MGRIKTVEIRSITNSILGKYSLESFSDQFYENKKKLKDLPEVFPSKKVLNRVAGAITREYKKYKNKMKELLG